MTIQFSFLKSGFEGYLRMRVSTKSRKTVDGFWNEGFQLSTVCESILRRFCPRKYKEVVIKISRNYLRFLFNSIRLSCFLSFAEK